MFQSKLPARAIHLLTQSFPSNNISLLGLLTLSGDAVERLGGAIQPSPPSCPKIGETSPKFLLDKYSISLFLALFLAKLSLIIILSVMLLPPGLLGLTLGLKKSVMHGCEFDLKVSEFWLGLPRAPRAPLMLEPGSEPVLEPVFVTLGVEPVFLSVCFGKAFFVPGLTSKKIHKNNFNRMLHLS